MQTAEVLTLWNRFKDFFLADYKNSYPNATHQIEVATQSNILFSLYKSIMSVARITNATKLQEDLPSAKIPLKKIAQNRILRFPNEPTADNNFDIDDDLVLACIYLSLSDFGITIYMGEYNQIIADYIKLETVINSSNSEVIEETIYFKYSSDGESWHSEFQADDIYLSIYQNDSWSSAIRFVGRDGVNTNSEPNQSNEPTNTGFNIDNFDEFGNVMGEVNYSFFQTQTSAGFAFSGDTTFNFDFTNALIGHIYTVLFYTDGVNTVTINGVLGDVSVDISSYTVIHQYIYDGLEAFAINNKSIPN